MKLIKWEKLDARVGVHIPPILADRLEAYSIMNDNGDISKSLRSLWNDVIDMDIGIERYTEENAGSKYVVRVSKGFLKKVDKLRGKVSRSIVLCSLAATALKTNKENSNEQE